MPIFAALFNDQAPVPRLPPEVAAQFAPGANVMMLNATRAEFRTMTERTALASTYVHEGYHLLQTVCTGREYRSTPDAASLVRLGVVSLAYP